MTILNDTPQGLSEGFGDRLELLLDKCGAPSGRQRKPWIATTFNVTPRTPAHWLSGTVPRPNKVDEITSFASAKLGLPKLEIAAWLITATPDIFAEAEFTKSGAREASNIDLLPAHLMGRIYKTMYEEANDLDIDINAISESDIDNVFRSVVSYVIAMERSGVNIDRNWYNIDRSMFRDVLKGQLALIKIKNKL